MSSGSREERGIRAGVRRLFRLPPRTNAMARDDADAELNAFLEARIDHLVARGMTPEEARVEALRRLGEPLGEVRASLRRAAERRERRRRFRESADALWGDIQFALRQFAQAPGFTALVVLTLALGIGINMAIFSVVHRLLLAPLPYPNGSRIVMPMRESALHFRQSADAALVKAWYERSRTVMSIAGVSELMFSVLPDGAIDTIPTAAITANFLPTLGVHPILGRGFAPEEERSGAAVAMISHALWRRSYGGRTDVIGAMVHHEGRPLTIVGVTPPGLALPLSRNTAPDVWLPAPLEQTGNGAGGVPGPGIFVTLRPGVTLDAATREFAAVAASLPDSIAGDSRLRLMRAQDFLDQRATRMVRVLFAAVGALLLIACANVANLLLARAWTRQREFAVRRALGGGRGRLIRQVLTESLLLAFAGGLLGVGITGIVLRVILALRPPSLDQLADVRLDPTVLLWAVGLSVATALLFGCAPALFAAGRQVGDVLRRETRGGSPGVVSRRVRSGLTVLEIAAALVLLVGAGLLVRSFASLQRMPLGFEPRGLVYADVLLGGPWDRDRVPALRETVVRRLLALPGVTGVAVGTMPVKGFVGSGGVEVDAGPGKPAAHVPALGTVYITPEYFRVARIALLAGRLPDSPTEASRRPFGMSSEVLVNREFARRAWPDESAIGGRLRAISGIPPRGAQPEPWATVVGVVDDTRMPDVRGDVAELQVYSLVPPRLGNVPFVVRTANSADVAAPMVKQAIASADPNIYVRQVLSGDRYLRDGLAPTRFAMALLTTFAVVALLVAAVGLYGVVAYGVAQRTREIGVRVALGAQPRAILAWVVGNGLRLAAAGAAIGAVVAVAATRVLETLLHGVSPADPPTFAAIVLMVVAIALLASYIPARRALRIDPAEALRAD